MSESSNPESQEPVIELLERVIATAIGAMERLPQELVDLVSHPSIEGSPLDFINEIQLLTVDFFVDINSKLIHTQGMLNPLEINNVLSQGKINGITPDLNPDKSQRKALLRENPELSPKLLNIFTKYTPETITFEGIVIPLRSIISLSLPIRPRPNTEITPEERELRVAARDEYLAIVSNLISEDQPVDGQFLSRLSAYIVKNQLAPMTQLVYANTAESVSDLYANIAAMFGVNINILDDAGRVKKS